MGAFQKSSKSRVKWCGPVVATALALTFAPSIAAAQVPEAQPAPAGPPATNNDNASIPTGVPPGFESTAAIETIFDVDFQGVSVGSFPGKLSNGVFQFTDPAAVAAALGDQVNRVEALKLLSQSLNSNESLHCIGNQKENCGLLPAGTSGVIVNPESFKVDIFLGREFLVQAKTGPTVLPNPISGPSLIESVLATLSADLTQNSETHVGGTFNTDASLGRTALISQISGDDITGFELQQGYVQRVQNNWLGSAGLLTSQNQVVLTNFRYVGADVTNYQTSTVDNSGQGTPLSILLPRHARVELYANGTLVSAREYDGGLVLLDTSALPTGSYNVRIIARDGGAVILDQTRPFTKAAGLPPPGKFVFDLSAGERVADFFTAPTGATVTPTGSTRTEFLPEFSGEAVLRGQVAHRIGSSSALTADLMLVGSNVYPEISFQTYHGLFSGLAGASVDTHGDYAVLVSGSAQIHQVSFTVAARYTDADFAIAAANTAALANQLKYQPFSQTGYDVFASSTFPLFKGTFILTASYDHDVTVPVTPDTYTYGVEYDRPLKSSWLGTDTLLSFYASIADDEKLIGLKVSFFKSINPSTSLNYDVGGEYAQATTNPPDVKTGAAPVVDVELTHTATIGSTDLTSALEASTDSQQRSVEGQAQAISPLGTAQLTASYQNDTLTNANTAPVTLDVQTGFVIGGGQVKLGLPTPGQAMILAVIDKPPPVSLAAAEAGTPTTPTAAGSAPAPANGTGVDSETVAAGTYRVVINSQPFNILDVGHKVAIPVLPYQVYGVSLQAVGAPTYDFDLTTRNVPVYPGNVVVLHWKARHVTTIFGRLVDEAGRPMANARVDAGTDTNVTDASGYFVLTGPDDANLVARSEAGQGCRPIPLAGLKGTAGAGDLLKVGDVLCRAAP
jgi:hypothetical protein